MTIRIGIAGISGRTGRFLVEEVARAGAALAGGIRRPAAAMLLGPPLMADIVALARVSEVVIDFTHTSSAEAPAAAGSGRVLGTSRRCAAKQAAVAAVAARLPLWCAN